MYSSNRYFSKGAVDGRIDDSLKEAQSRQMLRCAGIEQAHRTSRKVRRWLHLLGCVLVGLGQWLGRFDASPDVRNPAHRSQSA
jgi:hypothetical protein